MLLLRLATKSTTTNNSQRLAPVLAHMSNEDSSASQDDTRQAKDMASLPHVQVVVVVVAVSRCSSSSCRRGSKTSTRHGFPPACSGSSNGSSSKPL